MKKLVVALPVLFLLSGCFEIDNAINLKNDMSGTADFHLGINLEPMVVVMAQMGKQMEGKSGPLTKEELAKAKADFKKSEKKSTSSPENDPAKARAEMEKSLPPGIKLLDFGVKEKEFGVATDMKFGFEKLSQLVGVKLPSSKSDDPTKKSVIDTPFEGLEVIERGNTVTIRTKPQNPTEKVKQEEKGAEGAAPKMDPETEKMIKDAFSTMRVTYRITAPFKVLKTNAMRKEGQTLIWEYNLAKFEEMEKSKKTDDLAVNVTYQR